MTEQSTQKEMEQFSDKTNRLKYKQQQAELAEELRTIIKGDLTEECSLPFIGYEVMSDVFEKEGFHFECEDEMSDFICFIASKDGKEYRVYYSKENGTVSIALHEE